MNESALYAMDMVVPAIIGAASALKINRGITAKIDEIESELNRIPLTCEAFQAVIEMPRQTGTRDFLMQDVNLHSLATSLVFIAANVIPQTPLRRFLLCRRGQLYMLHQHESGLVCEVRSVLEMPAWNAWPWILISSRAANEDVFALLQLPEHNQPIPAKDVPGLGLDGSKRLAEQLESLIPEISAKVLPFGLPEHNFAPSRVPPWLIRLCALGIPLLIVSASWSDLADSGWLANALQPWLMAAMALPLVTNMANIPATHRLGDIIHSSGCSEAPSATLKLLPHQAWRTATLTGPIVAVLYFAGIGNVEQTMIAAWIVFAHAMLSFSLFPHQIERRVGKTTLIWTAYSCCLLLAAKANSADWGMFAAGAAPIAGIAAALSMFRTHKDQQVNRADPTAPGSCLVAAFILWGAKFVFLTAFLPGTLGSDQATAWLVAMTIPLMFIGLWNTATIAPVSERRWNSLIEAIGNANFSAFRLFRRAAFYWATNEIILVTATCISSGIILYGISRFLAWNAGDCEYFIAAASCLDSAAFIIGSYASRLSGWRMLAFAPALNIVTCAGIAVLGKRMLPEANINADEGSLIMLGGSIIQFVALTAFYLWLAREPEYFCFWRKAFAGRRHRRRPCIHP